MMTIARRFLLILALIFWLGGFTFHGAVVIHVAHAILGSHLEQGYITGSAANYLNLAAGIALALWAWDIALVRDRSTVRVRLRWGSWITMAICLGILVWLHVRLDELLDSSAFRILDGPRFYKLHIWYLNVSTLQWACGLLLILATLLAWRAEDQGQQSLTANNKGYRGMAMEGWIAKWYANQTGKSLGQFQKEAREIAAGLSKGSSVLEVAPGPGYLSIELAKLGLRVVGMDISSSFVRISRENAVKAGVSVDFQHGNASAMQFADASFDFVICRAAFKNFSKPVKAINEMCRVLRPGGRAVIHDLDRLASPEAIGAEVRQMHLGWFNAMLTKLIFKWILLRRAYSQDDFRRMAAESTAGKCEVATENISLKVTFRM
jgi:ubiquinone/menaquinone biosynthesis C-methylase UbiE